MVNHREQFGDFPILTEAPTASDQVNAQITVEVIYQAVLTEFDDDGALDENNNNTTETQIGSPQGLP